MQPTESPAPPAGPPVGEILGLAGGVLLALSLLVLPWHRIDLVGVTDSCNAVQCTNESLGLLALLCGLGAAGFSLGLLAVRGNPDGPRRALAGGALAGGVAATLLCVMKLLAETEFLAVGALASTGLALLTAAGGALALAAASPPAPARDASVGPPDWAQPPPGGWPTAPGGQTTPGWGPPGATPPPGPPTAPAPGWWLASDGNWYPPEQRPNWAPPPPPPTPRPPSPPA